MNIYRTQISGNQFKPFEVRPAGWERGVLENILGFSLA